VEPPIAMSRCVVLLLLCAVLASSGCTIENAMRGLLGGRNSDEVYLNRVNPRNTVSFAPDP
jgi:hypothetical protein